MALGGIRVQNRKEFEAAVKTMSDTTVPKLLQKTMQKASAFALRRVVGRTPRGDPSSWAPQSLPPPPGYQPGRAKGGWQVMINRTTETDINRIDPSGNAAIASGLAVIKSAQPFDVVYIFNNVPYIRELEDGWSKQAPRGMIKLTIAEISLQRFD